MTANANKKILPITVGLVHQELENPNFAPYRELDLFRKHLEQQKLGPDHQPYQAHKNKALAYQLVFIAFGLLFLCFGWILYSKSMTWAHTLFFNDGSLLKGLLYAFCGSSSGMAFWMASQIRAEKEAVSSLKKRSRLILRKIYHERLVGMGVKRFLPQGKHQKQLMVVKHHFHDAWDKVDHAVAVTKQLITVIATSGMLTADMKTKLFNQAILELQDNLHAILQQYQ